jgi:biofilm protein TabA
MITDLLEQTPRYRDLSPRFAAAFEFLRTAPGDLPTGRHDIDGDHCFALVQAYRTRPLAQARFEAHRRYADIQFIQSGAETILWAPLSTLTHEIEPHAAERDIAFFANPPHWTPIRLVAGYFSIFFPQDGHAPCLDIDGPGEVRKIVIKVEI